MDPVIALATRRVRVEPGGEARVALTVRNPGTIVEQYSLDVVGPAAAFAQVLPPQLSVYPGVDANAELVVRPPRGASTPAGVVPFAVRCRSLEQPDEQATAEGEFEIAGVLGLALELHPQAPRGRWRGKARLRVVNSGSVPVAVHLDATDPAEALGFSMPLTDLTVAAATAVELPVRFLVRSPTLRGEGAQLPFTIAAQTAATAATPAGAAGAATITGQFTQKPIVSRGVMLVAGLVVVGVAALVAAKLFTGGGAKSAGGAAGGTVDEPTNVVAKGGVGAVRVEWQRNLEADSYLVARLASGEQSGGQIDGVSPPVKDPQTVYVWSGLDPGHYCFEVRAVAGAKRSPPSAIACGDATAAAGLAAPSNVQATYVGTGPDGTVQLSVRFTANVPGATHQFVINGALDPRVLAASAQATQTVPFALQPVEVAPKVCVSVIASKGGASSVQSNQSCVTVPTATPTTAPAPPPTAPASADPTAKVVFDAWASGHLGDVTARMSTTASSTLQGHPYQAGTAWTFVGDGAGQPTCGGAAGSLHCAFQSPTETLSMTVSYVTDPAGVVEDAQFAPR